ncbi:hypothetical protein [Abditibacterium utsteinense]|uniref:hypothetical protein n=1 Tax=Abditibacterium utsteinense TaxID=1960156 RepID=UPI001300A9FE|nr:hypothetical protein [Abditibacterium utsteinense]
MPEIVTVDCVFFAPCARARSSDFDWFDWFDFIDSNCQPSGGFTAIDFPEEH